MIYFRKTTIIFLVILINTSCATFNSLNKDFVVNENQWTNEDFIFADISRELSKQKKINENWSSLNSNKSIPYFKLKNSSGKILGDYLIDNEKYLVINLFNNKKYKWKYNHVKKNILPAHIALLKDVEDAKELIGRNIWLNDIFSDSIFMSQSESGFKKFQKVNVVGVKIYQNSKVDCPIWLEIKTNNDFSSYVRYYGKFRFHSRQNNYFIENPIKKSWGEGIIKIIIDGDVKYGMNYEQVRASIGNPNMINNISSRHSVGQQWIYGNDVSKKRYLVFENGKLSSM